MNKQLLFLFFLLSTFSGIAGDKYTLKIDSILDRARKLRAVENVSYLKLSLEALDLANSHAYDKGIAEASFMAGDALINMGLYKQGFRHLLKVQETEYFKNETEFQAETHRLKGKTYMKVRLFDQAIREINIQMGVANRLQDSIKRKNYLYAYGDLEYVYTRLGKADSVEKYVNLQLDLVTTFNEKENALEYVNTFDALGAFYTQREQYDKARVYLNKSLALVEKYKVPIYFNTMTYMGTLEQFEDNIVGALVYFNKGLANMIQVGDWDSVRDRYKFLAEYYRYYKLGNEKADLYDVAYSRLNDSLENQNRKMMDTVLNHILKSNEEESTTKVTNYVNIIKITVAILIVVIIFFVWRSRRKSKILGAKDEALQETEIINKKLMEQIGENKFDKLIDLAKNNSPEFLTLFSELYPEFINALKSKDPNLRSTELEFCAMAFLNFSTKNIAEYTYVTIRAVQVRKNRLRKKFEIPSDADFNNWMREKV